MRCGKARKLIPLLAGGDLPVRRAAQTAAHIERCAGCRRHFEETASALARLRAEATQTAPRWKPGEFESLVASAVSRAAAERRRPFLLRPAPAAALVMLAVLLTFALFDRAFRRPAPPVIGPGAGSAEARPKQVISMVLVSPETGLQVTWFLDSDFEWKGE
jgi:predicted anti-sigma-YlaC factor YlaD